MTNFTQAEARKEINAIGKANGFIMRKQNMTINGAQSYKFEDRESGQVLISNMTFWSAYENAQHTETWIK
jgi:hypothetical protein